MSKSEKKSKTSKKHDVLEESCDTCEVVEVTPDGKQEIVEGREPLKKDPKKIKDRWSKLKKNLNNLESIMDLASVIRDEPQDDADAQSEQQLQDATQDIMQGEDVSQMSQDMLDEAQDQPGYDNGEYVDDDELLSLDEDLQSEGEFDQESHERELIELLRAQGYSEPEIAYIVHNHDFSGISKDQPEAPSVDVSASQQSGPTANYDSQSGQVNQMVDLEQEHKRKLMELELEKEKLELEKLKRHMELELEFKKREMEIKLKNMEQAYSKKLKD